MADHVPEQHRTPLRQLRPLVDVREHPVVLLEHVEVTACGRPEQAAVPAAPVVDADPVEGGDGRGGHQDRVRPGRGLVDAGREAEVVVLDELPFVRLVPHHRADAEQARAVVEPEGGRALLGELERALVADRLARPGGSREVVDEDVRFAGLLDAVGDRLERARRERVVAVEEEEVVPLAYSIPLLRAAPGPAFSRRSTVRRTRGSRAAISSAIDPQPSGEASSTTISSRSVKDWDSTESRHSCKYA